MRLCNHRYLTRTRPETGLQRPFEQRRAGCKLLLRRICVCESMSRSLWLERQSSVNDSKNDSLVRGFQAERICWTQKKKSASVTCQPTTSACVAFSTNTFPVPKIKFEGASHALLFLRALAHSCPSAAASPLQQQTRLLPQGDVAMAILAIDCWQCRPRWLRCLMRRQSQHSRLHHR
jgi:hypothetical protein